MRVYLVLVDDVPKIVSILHLKEDFGALLFRVVNGSVSVRIHNGPKTGTIKENVKPDSDPEPVRNQFFCSGTKTRTIYVTSPDLGQNLDRK